MGNRLGKSGKVENERDGEKGQKWRRSKGIEGRGGGGGGGRRRSINEVEGTRKIYRGRK